MTQTQPPLLLIADLWEASETMAHVPPDTLWADEAENKFYRLKAICQETLPPAALRAEQARIDAEHAAVVEFAQAMGHWNHIRQPLVAASLVEFDQARKRLEAAMQVLLHLGSE